ncbi:hypothetical protein F8388_016853 [Cannabis sativa]|uniref:Uncharacterized protein n=1 Tax=Cannabis sativa TaxID=3483 RepID=A0A7J6ERI4_CANSA|nr:hypothetical protein F8388_016853 [Cannabis sativa]
MVVVATFSHHIHTTLSLHNNTSSSSSINPISHHSFPHRLTLTTTNSSIFFTPSFPKIKLTASSAALGGSGGGGGNDSGGGGGGGDGDGDENRKRNRGEAIMAMAEANRSLESLPKDMAAAIEAGRLPGSIVKRYFELEKSAVFRWLLGFEYMKVMAIIADFMLVWLPAPTVSLRSPLAVSAGTLANFFHACPENAFQVALAGSSYSFVQRVGAIVRNGSKLFAVGTSASLFASLIELIGTGVTNGLINVRKALDKSFAGEAEDVPILPTSVAYGVYMAVSSNLRWVDYARWIGIQKTRD